MDIFWSIVFDTMPHTPFIEKLNAYVMSEHAYHLISTYLRNRNHRVKLWVNIVTGQLQNAGFPTDLSLRPTRSLFSQWFLLKGHDLQNRKLRRRQLITLWKQTFWCFEKMFQRMISIMLLSGLTITIYVGIPTKFKESSWTGVACIPASLCRITQYFQTYW